MYKLILSDFNKTIIDDEESINTDIVIRIDELRREKRRFSVCYDLDYKDILYYDKSFHFIDYIISYSGSIIYDVNKNKIIYKKHIFVNTVKKITNSIKDCKLYSIDKRVYRIDIDNNKMYLDFIKSLDVFYYIEDDKIIITGSDIYNAICYLCGEKYSFTDILCIPYDNKFLSSIDAFKCFGLSNCKLKVKKIKYDNNQKGILQILKQI